MRRAVTALRALLSAHCEGTSPELAVLNGSPLSYWAGGEEMNPMHATFVTACVQVLQEGVADTLREPCVLGLAWLFSDLGRVTLAVPRMAAEAFS